MSGTTFIFQNIKKTILKVLAIAMCFENVFKHLHNIISKTNAFDTLFSFWEVEKHDFHAFKNYSTNSLFCEEINTDGSYGTESV